MSGVAARWLRHQFFKVILVEYLVLVLSLIATHASESRAYGFLYEVRAELLAIQTAADDRRSRYGEDLPSYRLGKLEERVDRLHEKFEAEAAAIRTSTFWILGTFVGTMMSVLTSTIVYIVVTRRRGGNNDG